MLRYPLASAGVCCWFGLCGFGLCSVRLGRSDVEMTPRFDAYAAAREDDVASLLPLSRPAESGHALPGRPS